MIDQTEFSEHESESATWIALADLMTGLMAIFLVLVLIVLTDQSRKQIVVITAVTDALKKVSLDVTTDPKTGDVSIVNRDLLFDRSSAVLTPQGKRFLEQFVPQYSSAIFSLDQDLSNQVVRIVVEGRTSHSNNKYVENIKLSLDRASAVVEYVYQMKDFKYKREFLQRLTPVGRGYMEAKYKDSKMDREVLFRFQFKGVTLENSTDLHAKIINNSKFSSLNNTWRAA